MTDHDQNAVAAMVSCMQPAHTMQGFAINILDAIRAGKVPGINSQSTTDAVCVTLSNHLVVKHNNEIAALRAERDEARNRAIEAWKDADAAIEGEVALQVAAIMGSPDNEIARQKASREVFRNERDALQIECSSLRSQLAHARSRGDDKEIAEKERDAALARVKEVEGELSYIRGLHMSSAELVGADYVAYQDETPALIARMFKDAEQQRDALKADNERLRGLLGRIVNAQHSPTCFRLKPDPACPRCEAVREAFKELSQ